RQLYVLRLSASQLDTVRRRGENRPVRGQLAAIDVEKVSARIETRESNAAARVCETRLVSQSHQNAGDRTFRRRVQQPRVDRTGGSRDSYGNHYRERVLRHLHRSRRRESGRVERATLPGRAMPERQCPAKARVEHIERSLGAALV